MPILFKELEEYIYNTIEAILKGFEDRSIFEEFAYEYNIPDLWEDVIPKVLKNYKFTIDENVGLDGLNIEDELSTTIYTIFDLINQTFYDFYDIEYFKMIIHFKRLAIELIGLSRKHQKTLNVKQICNYFSVQNLEFLSNIFSENSTLFVYERVSKGIIRIYNRYLFDGISAFGKDRNIYLKNIWIEYFKEIKHRIESDLIINGKDILKNGWAFEYLSEHYLDNDYSRAYYKKEFAKILLPHPTQEDTMDFVNGYLMEKSKTISILQGKHLLREKPTEENGTTSKGYYPLLGAFFHTAKEIGIIYENINPKEFIGILDICFNNRITRDNELQINFKKSNKPETKVRDYFDLFDDMGSKLTAFQLLKNKN